MRLVWLAGLCLGVCISSGAQAPEKKTDAEIKAEASQADALYQKQNFLGALPLYEDLHIQQPQSLVFQERLAMTLLNKAGEQPEPAATDTRKRAKALLLQARAGGDDSALVQVLLEKLASAENSGPPSPPPLGAEWMKKAETAFSNGDLQTALLNYQKALEVNPQYYSAALFAGDVEYKMGHPTEAGAWFAKAIAINPDIETAYRYWGDCLEKAGEHKLAESKFIQGIVAEPYTRTPRVGLKQWADANHARIVAPPITLPAAPTAGGKPGDMTINLDPTADSNAMMRAIIYTGTRASWRTEEFKKHFPEEKTYRHSLPEEAAAIRAMLSGADGSMGKKKKDTRQDASVELLTAIEKDGMLECYILLDNPDQGIAQDYVAYRNDHRELLAQYMAKYDVHPM